MRESTTSDAARLPLDGPPPALRCPPPRAEEPPRSPPDWTALAVQVLSQLPDLLRQFLVVYRGRSQESQRAAADEPASPELKESILAVLTEAGRPLKAVLIARHSGRSLNGHFYRTLQELVDAGEITHDRQARIYRIAGEGSQS